MNTSATVPKNITRAESPGRPKRFWRLLRKTKEFRFLLDLGCGVLYIGAALGIATGFALTCVWYFRHIGDMLASDYHPVIKVAGSLAPLAILVVIGIIAVIVPTIWSAWKESGSD